MPHVCARTRKSGIAKAPDTTNTMASCPPTPLHYIAVTLPRRCPSMRHFWICPGATTASVLIERQVV